MNDLLELMLSNALAASVFAVLAYGLCGFIRSARARHALWLCVLVRLFLPPVWTVPLFDRPIVNDESVEALPLSVSPLVSPDEESSDSPEQVALNWIPEFPREEETTPADEPLLTIAPVSEFPPFPRWEILLGITVPLGASLILLRGWVRVRRLRRELGYSREAPEAVIRRVETLAGRMGLSRVPEVCVVVGRLSPMVWCPGLSLRRAKLLLPRDLLDRLTPEQRDSILVHELAHLKRGDHGVRWLELLCVCVYWWFPLLGWIRRELRKHEEACCDEWVVSVTNDPRSYADALVETLVFLDGPTPSPFLASGVTPARDLQRRIRMIMQNSPIGRWARLGVVTALCLSFVALAIGPGISQSSAQEETPKKRAEGKKEFEGRKDFEGRKEFEGRKSFEGKKDEGRREFRRDGDKGDRKEGDRKESIAAREEIEKARREVEEARKQMEKAIRALVEAEEKMARMEGRRFEGFRGFPMGGGFGGSGGFPKEGGFPGFGGFGFGGGGGEGRAKGKDGDAPKKEGGPMGGGFGFGGGAPRPKAKEGDAPKTDAPPRREERREGGRGGEGPKDGPRPEARGGDRLDQLEQQIKRLTDELDAMRREMRRGPEPVPAPRREFELKKQ